MITLEAVHSGLFWINHQLNRRERERLLAGDEEEREREGEGEGRVINWH